MSKNIYRAGELRYGGSDVLLGERPGITSLRSRYLRDIEDEISRVKTELAELRATYEREAKEMADAYGQKKTALEADLAQVRAGSEEEARRIRDSAQAQLDGEKKRGYDEGLASGRQEGLETAAKSIADELARMRQKIHEAREAFLDHIAASESKLIETALAVAERVVRQKIRIDPAVVREAVREALAQVRDAHPLRIRVHPDDVAHLEEFRKLSPDAFRDMPATFLADETLQPGDAVVETGLEFIDATVAKKLETLRDRLIPRSVL